MFRKPSFIGMQKSHRKQNKKITVIKNNKTKVVVGAYLSRSKKKAGYIIPTMNCSPRNG